MKSEFIKKFMSLTCSVIATLVIFCGNPTTAQATSPKFELIKSSYYHPTTELSFGLSDLRHLPESQWTDISTNYGFTHRTIYARHFIKVSNGDGTPYSAHASLLYDVGEFWVLDGSSIIGHSLTGAAIPRDNWTSDNQVSGVEFKVTGNTDIIIYQRIKHSTRILSNLKIGPANTVLVSEHNSRVIYFIFLGAIIILAAHNIAMYRATKEMVFLNYLMFISVMVVSLSGVWGTLSPLIAHLIPEYADKIRVFHAATTFVIINMLHTFLERKSLSSSVNWMADVFKGFSVLVVLGAFFDADTAMTISSKCSMAMVLVVYIMTINAIYRGNHHAYYALLALTGPAVGFLANHVMLRLDIDPPAKESLTMGFLFEGAVMSFGMSERVRRIKLLLLEQTQESNIRLEKTVKDRTASLADANAALQAEIEDRRKAQILAEDRATIIKNQQSEILLAARGQAVANLSLGISHEINNPLAIAQGYIFVADSLAKQRVPPDDKTIAALSSVQNAINRIAGIVRTLRDFSDMLKPQTTSRFSLHDIFEVIPKNFTADNGVTIAIEIEAISIPYSIQSDVNTLKKCFNALLSNAVDAVAHSPNPKITVRYKVIQNSVEFLIADNGPGITPDIVEHMFDPFFTTGSPAIHKGLGLTSARLLCESIGGSVRYDTSAAQTTFIISVPLAESRSTTPSQPKLAS